MEQLQISFPIVIAQGADFSLPINYQDGDGLPVDLSNYTGKMQIRQTVESSGEPLVELTSANNGITIGDDGLILVFIPASITINMPSPYKGHYDLFIFGDGVTEKILWGEVTIYPRVTR